jgi:hypothetical protein
LIAIDVRTRQERSIAENVADFVPAPNSVQIALIRGVGAASEIWLVQRDGSNLRQITRNRRAEASLAWSPDSSALAYGSSSSSDPYDSDWLAWSRWCAVSEIRVVDLTSTAEKTLAPGCDPAISPDGKRIAYVAPPASAPPEGAGPLTINSVRLINRLGQNGWNFARAQGGTSDGLIVYAPAWSPDGGQVSYHRYVGMQVEVDLNLTEIGRSFEGKGQALADGAGWLLPARFSPDGQLVVISEHDAGNARGLIGYGAWRTQIVRLAGTREIMLPEGPKKVLGQAVEVLPGAQRATWAPGASALAVEIPAGWQLNADPTGWGQSAGEIWRWLPGKGPTERMAANVDYSSPLSWLPAN